MRVTVSLLFVLAILLWSLFPLYVPTVARMLAQTHQVDILQMDASRPWLSGWSLHNISAEMPNGIRITAVDIRIYWRPVEVLNGRLLRIDIGELELVPTTGDQSDTALESTVIPTAIPAYVLEQLPVEAWSIALLRTKWSPLEDANNIEIQSVANGNKSNIYLFSRLHVRGAGTYLSTFRARPGVQHSWRLKTHPGQQPVLQVEEQRPEPGGLQTTGQAQVEAGRLSALLQALGQQASGPPGDALTGQVRLHWRGMLPAQIHPAHPLRGLTLDGEASTEFDYAEEGGSSARLDAALAFGLQDGLVQWELAPNARLRISHPELKRFAVEQLAARTGAVWAELTSAAPLRGSWRPEDASGSFTGTLHLELRGGDRLLGHHRLGLQQMSFAQGLVSGALRSTGSLQPKNTEQASLTEFGWDLTADAEVSSRQIILRPGLGGSLRIQGLALQAGPTAPPMQFNVSSEHALLIDPATGKLDWPGLQIVGSEDLPTLLQPYLETADVRLFGDAPRLQLRELRYDPLDGLQVFAELRVANLQQESDCCRIGPLRAALQAGIDASGARGALQLQDRRQQPVLQSDWQLSAQTERLEGTLNVLPGLTLPDGQQRLTALLSPWPDELELLAGSHHLEGRYWYERAQGFNADFQWEARDWVVKRGDVLARGIAVDAEPEIRASGIGLGQYAHIQVEEVDAGFPIRNIQGDLWVRIPLRKTDAPVLVRHFSAELLGGRVSAAKIPLPVGREEVQFALDVEGVDLSALLQLEQRDNLTGSGKLDGRIPVRWTTKGLSVDQGRLAARAPGGFLQFQADDATRAMADSQPGLRVALQALENFQYDQLEAGLNYREDGDLLVNLKIHGENPELHDGHPVHLHINVEENLLSLLKSLQVSGELSDRIGEQFRTED